MDSAALLLLGCCEAESLFRRGLEVLFVLGVKGDAVAAAAALDKPAGGSLLLLGTSVIDEALPLPVEPFIPRLTPSRGEGFILLMVNNTATWADQQKLVKVVLIYGLEDMLWFANFYWYLPVGAVG